MKASFPKTYQKYALKQINLIGVLFLGMFTPFSFLFYSSLPSATILNAVSSNWRGLLFNGANSSEVFGEVFLHPALFQLWQQQCQQGGGRNSYVPRERKHQELLEMWFWKHKMLRRAPQTEFLSTSTAGWSQIKKLKHWHILDYGYIICTQCELMSWRRIFLEYGVLSTPWRRKWVGECLSICSKMVELLVVMSKHHK